MNFFLDHDVPVELGRLLRLKGHSVQFLGEVLPRNTDDLTALPYAAGQGLVIITCNRRAFVRLATRERHAGVIVLVRRRLGFRQEELAKALETDPATIW